MTDDLHVKAAAKFFGVPEDQVTEDQRWWAKQAAFLENYGLGKRSLPVPKSSEGGFEFPDTIRDHLMDWVKKQKRMSRKARNRRVRQKRQQRNP